MDAHELIESMGKMIAAYDMLTSSVEVNQRAILDLAAQVEKLRERMERLDNLHSIMSCHIVPEMKPKFGPVLDDAKPAPEDAPLPHHGYTIEVPVYVDGMMQVWVPMPEGCAVPRVFIGHASWFKGWRESK